MKKRVIAALIICLCILLGCLLTGVFLRSEKVAFSTEHYKINERMLDYYVDLEKNDYVEKYKREYGDYFLKAAGLDTEKSLKKQESCYGGTWYEYFRDLAAEKLKNKLLYCEAAKKSGLKANGSLLKKTEKRFKVLLDGIKKADLKTLSELEALSETYLSNLTASFAPSDKEKNEYYEKNRRLFDCVDYNRIIINSGTDTVADLTDKIVDSIKEAGFEETLKLYDITDSNDLFEVEYKTGYMYEDETQFGSWAFSADRKVGDVVCFGGRGVDSVYFIKKTAYPADYKIRKIQKITVSADSIKGTVNDLYEIARKLGENNTEENLLTYADKMGFEVENIDALKEELSLSLKNWLYDSEHKTGDYAVLEDGFSVSFVRYFGEGESYLDNRLTNAVVLSKTDDRLKQLKKEIKIRE